MVRAPRVNDKRADEVTGARRRFCSAILPACARKFPRVAEVLPLLYLHGLSSSDFVLALEQLLGSAAGLSATTITRLTTKWQDEAVAFSTRSLAGTDYVYGSLGCLLRVRDGRLSFDELALEERGAGADERDEVWCVDRAPALLCGLDQLERHRDPGSP